MSKFQIKQRIDAFKNYEFEFVEKFEQLKEVEYRQFFMGVTALAMEYSTKSPDLVVSLLEDRIIGSENPGLSMQSMSMIIQVTLTNKIYRDLFDLNIVKTFAHCYKTCQQDLPSKKSLKDIRQAFDGGNPLRAQMFQKPRLYILDQVIQKKFDSSWCVPYPGYFDEADRDYLDKILEKELFELDMEFKLSEQKKKNSKIASKSIAKAKVPPAESQKRNDDNTENHDMEKVAQQSQDVSTLTTAINSYFSVKMY